ncbi:aspartyl protease family protein [uncultured Sphingomonas sp.]|uniref:aspartyl protease family protein n=1 Tax=uncultured Sphingomonas sp. TaxID=158754 RepID=UPI0035CBC93A
MHRLLPLAALLIAAQSPGPKPPVPIASRDPGRFAIAPDAEARWVPFDLTPGNQVRFIMTVDGRPATAILDTGVSFSVLSRGFAGLEPKRVRAGGEASTIGGAVPIGWVPTAVLELGGVTRTGGGLVVATLPALATGSAAPVDLLVGRDLLARHALDIDYPGRRFRLLPSGRLPFRGAVAPLRVSATRRVYETELRLGGRRVRPVIVDTGDGSPVTVTRAHWQAVSLAVLPTTSALSYGLAGPVIHDLAIAPEIGLGALTIRNVEVRIEPADGFSGKVGVAGRIGSGLFGRRRVLLDPGAGRMVFGPGPAVDVGPVRSTSGLLVGILPDRLRVLHVMRSGPAAASGWKDGDLICAVDSVPVTAAYPASPQARWTVGDPGRVVALRTCAGVERSLTLKRFY